MVGKKLLTLLVSMTMVVGSWMFVPVEAADAAETRLNIVGMGDSYSSGAGGLHYYGKQGCYKSINSYSELFSKKNLGAKVVYENLACAGAVTSHIDDQIQELTVREREAVDLVLISIGGNDGKFSDIVKECFAPIFKDVNGCASALNHAQGMRQTIMNRMQDRLEEIAVFMPDAKVTLVGYPNLIYDGLRSCDYTIQGTSVGLDPSEPVLQLGYDLEADQYHVVDQLNKKFPGRFQFVSLKKLYVGHENCGPKSNWLRGFLDTPVTSEWWHPNVEGYGATAKHLYDLKVHKGESDTFKYGNFPLTCGASVSHVSTYDGGGSPGWSHTEAIDVPVPIGTKIVSPASGKVTHHYSSGYGNYLKVTESSGREHYLAHLSSFAVSSGTSVSMGQLVAYSGNTGNTTGPHLHYEQRVGGAVVELNLEGPKLEWNPNFTSLGDRLTSHSVESANCGNATSTVTGDAFGGTEEIIFYNKSTGRHVFHDVWTDGGQASLVEDFWGRGWDIVVPLEVNGKPGSEILFYNSDATSTRGYMVMFTLSSTGLSKKLVTANWSKGWTHIVPIDLNGDGTDELILYNSKSGRYYIFDFATSGAFKQLRTATWSKGWQHIVPIELGGGGGEEIIFYKPGTSKGTGLVYKTSSSGLSTKLRSDSWSNGWSIIEPIDTDGNGDEEVMFYNRTTGLRIFQDISSTGSSRELSRNHLSTDWDVISAIEIDGESKSELLFYKDYINSSRGRGMLYNVSNAGISAPIRTYDWSKGWSHILTVQLPGK